MLFTIIISKLNYNTKLDALDSTFPITANK